MKNFYLVTRPSMKGTNIPIWCYTFAEDEDEAKFKVEMKWGSIDNKTQVKEIKDDELNEIVIGTNFFG